MNKNRKIAVLILSIAAVVFVLGCAETTKELLAEDYNKMNNEELLRYYYRLNDEIERQERPQGPEIGFGLGSFGHGTGVGVGAATGTAGYTADDLRKRRIDVRMELQKRKLNP
ncbi:MAG: hypothetical protein ACXWMV_10405 [Syntrophales bacterium]